MIDQMQFKGQCESRKQMNIQRAASTLVFDCLGGDAFRMCQHIVYYNIPYMCITI